MTITGVLDSDNTGLYVDTWEPVLVEMLVLEEVPLVRGSLRWFQESSKRFVGPT